MNRLHDGHFGDATDVLLRVPRCDAPAPKAAPRTFVAAAPPPRSLAWDFLPKLALAGLVVGLVAVAGVVFQNPDSDEPLASESTSNSEIHPPLVKLELAEATDSESEWPGTLAKEESGAFAMNASLSDEVQDKVVQDKNDPSRLTVEPVDTLFARQTTSQPTPSPQASEQPSPSAERVAKAPKTQPQIVRGSGQSPRGMVANPYASGQTPLDDRPPIAVAEAPRQSYSAAPVAQAHLEPNIAPVATATEYHVPNQTRR